MFANAAAAMFLFLLLPALYGAVQMLPELSPVGWATATDLRSMKPLRQVDIGMPILLISFEKFTFNQMFLGFWQAEHIHGSF